MDREELSIILELHQKWLNKEEGGICANLRCADLKGADLTGADLRGANLEGADLRCADLEGANLRCADLKDVKLTGANLKGANLTGAKLEGADLKDAKLEGAKLIGAKLEGTDLRGADLEGANLDYSCLPLWCGSLFANMDDRHVKQLLYHTLSIVKHSNNVSELLKERLLTEENLKIAKEFHRAGECNKL